MSRLLSAAQVRTKQCESLHMDILDEIANLPMDANTGRSVTLEQDVPRLVMDHLKDLGYSLHRYPVNGRTDVHMRISW